MNAATAERTAARPAIHSPDGNNDNPGARWSTNMLQPACHQALDVDAIDAVADALPTDQACR